MSALESTSLQTVAAEALAWFEVARRATGDTATGPREDGEEYVRAKSDCPQWVTDMIYEAHGGFLPDDYRYRWVMEVCESIADGNDDASTFADSAVDVYTGARLAWLSSNLQRPGYCDEAADEFGWVDSPDIVDRIGWGQFYEASEVFGLVLSALQVEDSVRRAEEVS